MNIKGDLEKFREGLKQQRDELLVQAGLAKLEARDEWEKAEKKLDEFKIRLDELTSEARDATEDVWTGVKTLGEEIKTAYERIREKL